MRKNYPVPLKLRPSVDHEIDKMLRLGIIEKASSEYCNPLRVVPKKNGQVRLCLDARFINKNIAADNESPPLVEELMQKFEGVVLYVNNRSCKRLLAGTT